VIVGFAAASEQVGLVRNVQLLEPRRYGLAVAKRWSSSLRSNAASVVARGTFFNRLVHSPY
jgi:hypothetical protein